MSGRLNGETEDEIRKDAEALSALFGRRNPAPRRDNDPPAGNEKNAAFKKLLDSMKGEK